MHADCGHGNSALECPDCNPCDHDVVVNGACFYCGSTEIAADIKAENELIPVSQLVRRRD